MEGFTKLPKMQCFKEGGSVTNVYEAKKSSGDKDNIRKVKDIAPAKAAAPSKAATKPAFKGSDVSKENSKPSGEKDFFIKSKESGKTAAAPSAAKKSKNTVTRFKKGGGVKKFADGGDVMDMIRGAGTTLRNNIMGTPEQNRIAQANMDRVKARKAAEQAALLGSMSNKDVLNQGALAGAQAAPMPAPTPPAGTTPMKRGGKAMKKC